ncbi:MAG: hypothetical protein A3A65_03060 [Candidatus Chisholmbacteria bacterium RIFCSPLOWO2_01_FULL_49_14]|uniref:Glycosyltransferase 2-like domain-containing protein n=1 Tax=Candidatus Chisholmbacteria bacterium RIFCSPLOWO2_01_FULL_49_14 TaxID=1797593 RepID=A0A1G1W3N1_9BACT|nr:MAG: hypothetical protein A3A65_03060 [Candidatus Chisholmbacteria bacterium RIFCSPLOWO2_01_FULL_49_14]
MKEPGITAQMLVKNEEYWIWYSVRSILPFANKVMIFDTGSTDETSKIIGSIHSAKLTVDEKGDATRQGLVQLRNEMKQRTTTDWILLVDGDEVWPRESLKKLGDALKGAPRKTWGIVVRTRNCVGDVWHYQPEAAGRYELLGRKGHLSIRAYRNLPGFKWQGEYPNEAFCDTDGKPINGQDEHLRFIDTAYWHLTHLHRSTRTDHVIDRRSKKKLEIGIKAKPNELPEVFFSKHPSNVHSPFKASSFIEKVGAAIATPLRRVKRRMLE